MPNAALLSADVDAKAALTCHALRCDCSKRAACLGLGKKAKVQLLRLDPSKAPRWSAAQMANRKAASSVYSSLPGYMVFGFSHHT